MGLAITMWLKLVDHYKVTYWKECKAIVISAQIELSGLGTTKNASNAFGGKPVYLLAAFKQLQQQLYRVN